MVSGKVFVFVIQYWHHADEAEGNKEGHVVIKPAEVVKSWPVFCYGHSDRKKHSGTMKFARRS